MGHRVHTPDDDEPVASLKRPESQGVHLSEPYPSAWEPGWQGCATEAAQYEPGGHGKQEPSNCANSPGLQEITSAAVALQSPDEAEPGEENGTENGQGAQPVATSTAPSPVPYVLAAQARQALGENWCVRGWYLPEGQSVHSARPGNSE